MSKNLDKRLWGVLGKQQTYFSPQKQVEGKKKVPLNSNAFDSWDVKRSRFRRVDGYENAIQQGGVVPQPTSGPVVSPSPTPSITPSPTPSFTPTMTPSITPSSTPYPLPINPSLWWDASDSSTFTLISSGGTDYVSTWNSKGTSTWSLSGTNTNTMPTLSASTLLPGNPNIVRFVPNATTTLRDALSSFGNTQISHTGGTWFYVWAKPSGSTYATALFTSAVYSGLTNGGTVPNSSGGFIDRQFLNLTNVAGITNNYSIGNNQIVGLSTPVYSATGLNDKYIMSCNFQDTTGEFNFIEINQSAQTNTTSFTGSSAEGNVNSFIMGMTITSSAGTQSYNNSNVELAEVMWFNVDLTPAQREQVELYLKDKWRYDEWASPVPTPTPTASSTQTPTPSITPTLTNTPTPSSTPPAFSPSSLSPDIWIDFSDATQMSIRTSGGASFLQSINNKGTDLSITGFSQTTAADQPRIKVSTIFTGTSISAATISNDWLTQTGITGNNWTTVVVLGRSGTGAASVSATRFEWAGGNSATLFWNLTNTTTRQGVFSGANTNYDFTDPGTKWTGQTYLQYFSSSAATTIDYAEINGSGMTLSQSGVDRINWPQSGTMFLLNQSGAVADKQADMGEIIMLRRELTSTEKTNLYNYLRTKWGLTY